MHVVFDIPPNVQDIMPTVIMANGIDSENMHQHVPSWCQLVSLLYRVDVENLIDVIISDFGLHSSPSQTQKALYYCRRILLID